jgi:hypothetical protein
VAEQRNDVLRIEAQSLAELGALHADPVFYGRGVARGDGRLVVVVPGLFGNDMYLQPLRGWLTRIGYAATRSSLTLNAGCPNRLRRLVTTEKGADRAEHGRGVHTSATCPPERP